MICDSCGEEVAAYTRKRGKTVCKLCQTGRRASCENGFVDLWLTHVRTPDDKPVHVTSLRQLRAIEREHKCLSAVANLDGEHVNEPPQMRKTDAFQEMSREGKWLYPDVAEAMLADMRQSGELF